jgi:hypothetical protein
VYQSAVLDSPSFDPFSFEQDGIASAEVNIGRRQVSVSYRSPHGDDEPGNPQFLKMLKP